ncbi:hypothetical protein F4827_006057 [Paraburkholderia bannensis]|uniref:DUF4123 domain-containing protein n=1 Tax=Paraburkholderia bannensis TaxID=765414 RepID=A0A7W9U361_9BURK|nr:MULTISPECIES: DUF4123 domain-containing protein [Paraburkholderia]MBB3261149.1 hypothetical protein [Paraburkholderia sp. WP4_3_2]MBB6106186.1 hypothetical protein [Paraburkholderia bannensis]
MTSETQADPARRIIETALAGTTGLHAYVLVDGALLQTQSAAQQERWPFFLALPLLANADLDAQAVGPLLYELPSASESDDTGAAVETGIVWPASSVIVSRLSLNELATHLRPMLDVQLEQMDSTMLMRFFDPRVLPFWLDMLPMEHRAWLARGVHDWIYLDAHQNLRSARIETAHKPGEIDVIAQFPLHLSQQQEDDLLAACYPYTMIERLRSEFGTLMERVPLAKQYDFVRDQLDRCRAHGAESPASLITWCELALRYGPHFDEHPAMQPAIAALDDGQTFSQALALVPSGEWARMQAEVAN